MKTQLNYYKKFVNSINVVNLDINSTYLWNVFVESQIIVYFSNVILSHPLVTLDTFNDIAQKISKHKFAQLTLNLEKIGLPEQFLPFLS